MDPVIRRLFMGSFVCLGLSAIVIALAWTGVTEAGDSAGMLALRGVADGMPAVFTDIMRCASWLGGGWPRSIIAIGFIVFLMIKRYARAASYILYTSLGIAALNAWVLKAMFMRPRPEIVPRLIDVDASWSLPSGHAANSAAVFGAIALVASVIWWRRGQRRTIWVVTAVLVGLIGLSRVWLGVHWPSDVIAGWLVGAGWALLLAALLKPVKARAKT